MTYPEYKSKRKTTWPLWVLAGLIVVGLSFCIAGVVSTVTGSPAAPGTTTSTAVPVTGNPALAEVPAWPSTAPPATKAPPTKAVAMIDADTLVHVGEDVPAGTYRVPAGVADGCYWMKSSDAEGQKIIANDIVNGGRPQVTLKSGQWFTSSGCGEWIKK